jgi:hypothetical protein
MAKTLFAICGGIFVSSSLFIAHAAVSDSLTVRIKPYDSYPPAAITDLNATPGGVGQLLLEWSAPDSDNNLLETRSAATSYVIRIATISIQTVGSTTTWWNNANDVLGEPIPSFPGSRDSILLNGLATSVTHYAAIIGLDTNGNVSSLDVRALSPAQQAAAYLPGTSAPPTPTNFVGVALSTFSIYWSWDTHIEASFYTLNSFPSGALIAQTTSGFVTEGGLNPNAATSRTVRAANGFGISDPTAVNTVYTHAAVPINPVLSNVGFTTLNISWSANGNPAGTQYRVERSDDGTNFISIQLTSNLTFGDSGLLELTTYYYRLRAINGDGIPSSTSVTVSTMTQLQQDFVPPAMTHGLKGTLDSTGQAFTLIWDAVLLNQDGTPCTDLQGYNVYRRDSLIATPVKINNTPITQRAFADSVNGQVYYYTIRAVDLSGNEAVEDSLFVDSSRETNVIYLASDGRSRVVMPDSINELLRGTYNQFGVALNVFLEEEPLPSQSEIIRTVRLKIVRTDNNEEVSNFAFAHPQAIVGVGYNTVNGEVERGSVNPGSSNVRTTGVTPDQLSLYWNNGVTWVKVGGTVDFINQAVLTRTAVLGGYQLRISAQSSTLALDQGNVYPRVFTPNGDGHNDRVYFVLENPRNSTVTGEILDLKGRHVRTLPPPSGGVGTTLTWDGKDDFGSVAPGGAYIYKIQGDGKTFTGTVAVAR